MSGDPLTLVRFVCVAEDHAQVEGAAALTIHERAWAFCPAGGAAQGHSWQGVNGLPFGVLMSSTAVTRDGSHRSGAEPERQGDHLDNQRAARKAGVVDR